jgi:hypothetical protein
MHLADHRIAGNTAQFLGDLTGRLAFGPHALERLDALIRPGHGFLRFSGCCAYSNRQRGGYKRAGTSSRPNAGLRDVIFVYKRPCLA